jgi:hypothetical protein
MTCHIEAACLAGMLPGDYAAKQAHRMSLLLI